MILLNRLRDSPSVRQQYQRAVTGIVLLSVWGLVWWATSQMPQAARAFPRFILLGLVLFTLILVVDAVRKSLSAIHDEGSTAPEYGGDELPRQPLRTRRLLGYVAATGVYAVSIKYVGFDVSSAIFLAGCVWFTADTRLHVFAILPLIAGPFAIQWIAGSVLGIHLPGGVWR